VIKVTGKTPVQLAADVGNLDMVIALLDGGADVNDLFQSGDHWKTSLAAIAEHTDDLSPENRSKWSRYLDAAKHE
jgi:ankyrin repeat protein